jgi:hypothetical protein
MQGDQWGYSALRVVRDGIAVYGCVVWIVRVVGSDIGCVWSSEAESETESFASGSNGLFRSMCGGDGSVWFNGLVLWGVVLETDSESLLDVDVESESYAR